MNEENNQLPEEWVWTTLSNIVAINPKLDISALPDSTLISFIPMAAVEAGTGYLDTSTLRRLEEVKRGFTSFQEEDVLFAKITPCMENGKSAVARSLSSGVGFGSTEFHVLRPSVGIVPQLLYYYVAQELFRQTARAHMTGSAGQLRVPAAFLANISYPLAPFSEQQRIVAAIEQQFTRLDAGVAALRRAQAKLKRYRAAVLKAAVEGKLTEVWRAEHPTTEPASILLERILKERRAKWKGDQRAKGKDPAKVKYIEPAKPDTGSLPELPEGWCWATVEQIATLVTDGDHNPPTRVLSGIPHLTAKNIINSHIDFSGCTFIAEEDAKRVFQRYRPLSGDLIVTCVGTIGRTAIVPEDVTFSPDRNLAAIRPVLGYRFARFLEYCLQSPSFQTIMANASGSTAQPHLYLTNLRALAFPLPPLAEQELMIAEVEQRLSIVTQLEATVEANLKRAERLRQSILKEAFAGRLVPQDPKDEPASVLLERIRKERDGRKKGAVSNDRYVSVSNEPVQIDLEGARQVELWDSIGG